VDVYDFLVENMSAMLRVLDGDLTVMISSWTNTRLLCGYIVLFCGCIGLFGGYWALVWIQRALL